jgi:hypothetical protein
MIDNENPKTEAFRPISNTRNETLLGKLKFYGRMLVDLKQLIIVKDILPFVPGLTGDVLDIGCGQSPYRYVINSSQSRYHGIDLKEASKFDYTNSDITPFKGRDIPFNDDTFDTFICT